VKGGAIFWILFAFVAGLFIGFEIGVLAVRLLMEQRRRDKRL
jgi:uncharacterized membrane-anchored protein YhcB (DUF1043 family)